MTSKTKMYFTRMVNEISQNGKENLTPTMDQRRSIAADDVRTLDSHRFTLNILKTSPCSWAKTGVSAQSLVSQRFLSYKV